MAEALLGEGGTAVALHLRLREAAGATLYALASRLSAVASARGARLLVNDRVDVALAAGCDGVQLGTRSMSPRDARRLVGPDALIGASAHSREEAAAAEGADFLLVGTLYESGTHPGRAAAGTGLLRGLPLPAIGIGGITPARVPEVLAAGGAGVAVVRGIWRAASPREALRDYLSALAKG
jgi:thiamine-phosphate diphosphorylase